MVYATVVHARYLFLLAFDPYLQPTLNLQKQDIAHILKLLAPSSTHLQYHGQTSRNPHRCSPALLANGSKPIIKLQSTCYAISEERPISALCSMEIGAKGSFKDMQLQIGEVILTPDAQQLAISSRSMEEQLPGNLDVNQL